MAARQEPRVDPAAFPEEFRVAVAQMRAARLRPEIFCEEMPAPQRIAPFASALSADVTVDGEDVGTGRIVLLHDPAGNDAWEGTFRCVAYARAEIDPEMANDPLLGEVGWSWLTEALAAHGADYGAPSGTVTKVVVGELRLDGRRGRDRPAGDPGLLDAAARTHERRSGPSRQSARPRPPRGSVGGAAVHGLGAAPGAGGGHLDAEPTRTAWPQLMTDERPQTPAASEEAAAPQEPEAPPAPLLELRDGLPPVVDTEDALAETVEKLARRHRAPSPSTPSARRATATPPGPTWCRSAARAPAPR